MLYTYSPQVRSRSQTLNKLVPRLHRESRVRRSTQYACVPGRTSVCVQIANGTE